MQVTVKLHASLRPYGRSDSNDGLFPLETTEKATVREVIQELGIPPEKVKMILLNGRGANFDSVLNDGDRVALFPPEMAFNMYVAISFRRDLNHQEKILSVRGIGNGSCEVDGKSSPLWFSRTARAH